MTRQPQTTPSLLKLPSEPVTLPSVEKVSLLFREFAEPLLYADPGGPSDIDTLRTSLMIAMICWNVPVYEATASPLFEKGTRTLKEIHKGVSRRVAAALDQLVSARKSVFAEHAFLVLVDVQGKTLSDATIVAEARLPKRA